MNQRTIQGSQALATLIKERRHELYLTIEEAAYIASIGSKSWSRYESGESIRKDKVKGICKALKWVKIPDELGGGNLPTFEEYQSHEAWSQYLCDAFGLIAAVSFSIGSDILLDYIEEDLQELSSLPKSSHIGQLNCSNIDFLLPEQFLTSYNYDFLFLMKCRLVQIRKIAHHGQIIAHSVLDELLFYAIVELAESLILEEEDLWKENWEEWIFDMFDDCDIMTFLYSGLYIEKNDSFHFDNWRTEQFYCS